MTVRNFSRAEPAVRFSKPEYFLFLFLDNVFFIPFTVIQIFSPIMEGMITLCSAWQSVFLYLKLTFVFVSAYVCVAEVVKVRYGRTCRMQSSHAAWYSQLSRLPTCPSPTVLQSHLSAAIHLFRAHPATLTYVLWTAFNTWTTNVLVFSIFPLPTFCVFTLRSGCDFQ